MSKTTVKVWMPQMIPTALLKELPGNSQKQSKHAFAELRKSIRENGFDESLLVIPEGESYVVVSGNHRLRAGKAEGMVEFPCVVRNDWDDVQTTIQSVRRNYVRGTIDRIAFTAQVNELATTHALPIDVIYEQMGFSDPDAFAQYYQQQKEQEKKAAEAVMQPPAVRILEDLGSVVSTILSEYGHTVPHSFVVFPTGGKNHLYVASTPALKRGLDAVVEYCITQRIDINIALGGLLQIGLANSGFFKGNTEEVVDAGTEEGDSDLASSK